ncbi:ribosomal protein S3 [Trifolium medium]|uniref:Ribosomal protein S3 n=1 Tax=Trifolium medium TaxID=97028 RepID=A0A392RZN4_9FABA|nr:ribosomal protein S3 [Trifolium medium]
MPYTDQLLSFSPSTTKNLSKLLWVNGTFKHLKYAGDVNDIAFLDKPSLKHLSRPSSRDPGADSPPTGGQETWLVCPG